MTRRMRVPVELLCAVGLLSTVPQAYPKDRDLETVRMHVDYQATMLVIVSRDGAAAVRFFEPFEKGNDQGNGVVGTSYEWRYLEHQSDAVEETGKGRVFAKLTDGKVQNGSFEVRCGPLELVWSHGNMRSGSVEYNSDAAAVYPVAVDYFSERQGPNQQIKPADLRHFLYRDEAAEKAHRNAPKPDPEGDRHWTTNQIAGPIRYEGSVVVAKDPNGIATLTFKNVFHRQEKDNVTLDGVEYTYTFTSHDGLVTETGAGEVYERRRDDKYDKGRLLVQAGPIHFTWSLGGRESGWAYFDPTWIRISYADAAYETALLQAMAHPDRVPRELP